MPRIDGYGVGGGAPANGGSVPLPTTAVRYRGREKKPRFKVELHNPAEFTPEQLGITVKPKRARGADVAPRKPREDAVPAETVAAMAAAYVAGATQRQIAQEFGYSITTVNTYLRRAGVEMRDAHFTGRPRTILGPKTCEWRECGQEFSMRDDETVDQYRKRRTCGRSCAASMTASTRKVQVPDRTCAAPACDEVLVRREGEDGYRFKKRRTCSPQCSLEFSKVRRAEQAAMARAA